jgi:hypothetical protein
MKTKKSEKLKQKCKEVLGINFKGDLVSTKVSSRQKEAGAFCWYGIDDFNTTAGSFQTMKECLESNELRSFHTRHHTIEIVAE